MNTTWTFGRKVGAGFAALVLIAAVIAGIASVELSAVARAKDQVIDENAQTLLEAQALRRFADEKSIVARGYLLAPAPDLLSQITAAHAQFSSGLDALRRRLTDPDAQRELAGIADAEEAHQAAVDAAVKLRQSNPDLAAAAKNFDDEVLPRRRSLDDLLDALVTHEQARLKVANATSTQTAHSASVLVEGISVGSVLLAILLSVILSRTLSRQIGTAVQHVQSSSAELQAAANQQAAGAKEQATAMTEITTTITELLATSRQIAQSAQRVAQIATETASGAKQGNQILGRAQESVATIQRQVELIVAHMLDLGRKSQQIGGVLDIINELSEQTNILAINATIEAAGAGESGKRFAVVADEIRKLADRVGGSTKEIRALVEEVRSAVNSTVMTTEAGSKAVDAGARGFAEVTAAFRQIAGLVETTTEAAREIELSTKQQATAVEQVNEAIANVAQATRETEASSSQTLQTASELTTLSRDLSRLVQPQAAA